MLVLTRREHESICIGDNILLTIVKIRGNKVRLGIQAPDEVPVHRREVYEKMKAWIDAGDSDSPSNASSEPTLLALNS